MLRKTFLACGILSSLLYLAMNVFIPAQWPGYSSFSQIISELSAVDAPTRPLWIPFGILYGILLLAFGYGVVRAAAQSRPLRIAGALLLASAVFGFFWPPMHLRPVLAAGGGTLTDTLHIVWTFVFVVLTMLAMGFGAAAFGRRFRIYTIATMVILSVLGWLTSTYAAAIQANLPTPWVGVWERVMIAFQMLWIAVLSTSLLRAVPSRVTAFKTPEGEAAFMAAYDEALKRWPVPYQEFEIPSRFGSAYVIACGPKDAPPLVLLHGYMATSMMWGPNVADLARRFRVHAIDVMGQPGRSTPRDPISSIADYVAWLSTTVYGLGLNRFSLAGQSFGGWLALTYAIAEPRRLDKLVLLSPGGLLPMTRQFVVRGMLMTYFPSRLTVNSFMRWVGMKTSSPDTDTRLFLDLMYLGMKHYRFAPETLRVASSAASALSHGELSAMNVPTLVLVGEREVIYDAAKALKRVWELMPDVRGAVIPNSSHEMVSSQRRLVNAKVIDFLTGATARAAA